MIEALSRIHIGPCQQLEAEADKFTHAVVAINGRVPSSVTSALPAGTVLHVDVEDVHDALIIEHFAVVSEHIRGALQATEDARIAVVCAQGVSRSAALVCAYMMQYGVTGEQSQRPQTTLDTLEVLRKVYPEACPNDGFLQQLDVWREMGFRHDMSNGVYRSLRARQTAHQVQDLAQNFDMASLRLPGGGENHDGGEEDAANVDVGGAASTSVSYRCRSCRQTLATSQNVMVDVSLGGEGFTWRKLKKNMAQSANSSAGSSIFVEPMSWMTGINDEAQGKLYCPNTSCRARLGSFNWSGMQNESSQWITPAFQLHLSRLDAIEPRAAVTDTATIDIRRPKLFEKRAPEGAKPASSCVSCLIFDCDGVLVDSERASCEALRRSILQVTQFDIPHAFPEDFVPVFGMDVLSCLEYYLEAHQQHEAFERAAAAAGASAHPDSDPSNTPDTKDWIAILAARVADAKGPHYEAITKAGIHPIQGADTLMRESCSVLPTAIASSGSHAKIRHNLSSAGLWGIVPDESIVSAEDVPRGKPAPDVYLKALEAVGCQDTARGALVIEDSIHGIHAAISAGVGHIAAMTTSLNEEQMMSSLQRLRDSFVTGCAGTQQGGKARGADGPDEVRIGDTRCVIIGSSLPPLRRLMAMMGLEGGQSAG